MKFSTIFAATAAIFAGFVSASPIAAPNAVAVAAPVTAGTELVTRSAQSDAAETAIIDILLKLDIDIDTCNAKYTKLCSGSYKCGSKEVKDYSLEVAALINVRIAEIKAKIFVGLQLVKIDVVVKLVVDLLVKINVTLNLLCKGLGLVGGLLVQLLLVLCLDLKIALVALINLLATICVGLVVKVKLDLGGLLGGLLCLVCSLLSPLL